MRQVRAIGGGLALAMALVACPAGTPVAPRASASPAPRTTPRAATPTPGPRATGPRSAGTPTPGGGPAGTPTPTPALLRKPARAITTLRGTIRIDAGYALSAGGGSIVSNNGSSVLAMAEIGLLSNNGGNVIADSGGTLLSDKGLGLVSKTKLALLQAPAAPAPGAVLPAAGMRVEATALGDGKPVALGEDAAGQPVYAVHSDAAGAYEVYVPADLAGNLVFTASVPGSQDQRLRYDLLVPAKDEAARAIDEDTALVARFQRLAYVNVLVEIFTAPDITKVIDDFGTYDNVPPAVRDLFTETAREFRAAADASGLTKAPRDAIEAVAARAADAFNAHVDFDGVTVGEEALPVGGVRRENGKKALGQRAVAIATRAMRLIREQSAGKLAASPTFFDGQAYFQQANAERAAAGLPAHAIKRPSDVGRFLVDAYFLGSNASAYNDVDKVMTSLDALNEPEAGVPVSDLMFTANNATALAVAAVMFGNVDGAKDEALAIVRGWKP